MRLTDIEVSGYGPLPRFAHECTDAFEVFYGPNESGKTLLLEAVLKLLAPDVDSVIPAVSRVDHSPTGHVVVETNGSEHKLGDDTVLGDIADVSPRHLRNVFVVRDSDLDLRNEHEFYDSVSQQIGDLHTAEIDAIQSEFVDAGRLTSVSGRSLSAAQDKDGAADVRESAAALAAEIRDYVEDAEETDVAAAEREIVSVRADLQRCERDLATQTAAETWDTHATLSERLETFVEATRDRDDAVSRATLEQLQQLRHEIAGADDRIDALETERAELREERATLADSKRSVEAALTPITERADAVDEVDSALDASRDSHADSLGTSRGMAFARNLALAGIGLGGAAALLGSTVAGLLLAGLGALAAGWYGLQHRAVTAAERERDRLLQAAQDAGLKVTAVDDAPAAIREFRDEVTELQARKETLARELDVKDGLVDDRESELESERETRRTNRAQRDDLLQTAGVTTIEAYRDLVEQQENLDREREQAAQSLRDTLGEPDVPDPDPAQRREYWAAELDAMVADCDDDVSAAAYDPDRLATLREKHEALQERERELVDRLDDHERRLREFEDRVREIDSRPFLDDAVSLPSRSIAGLRDVASALERLVERIERDADVAREALDIFDDLQATEEQKITDLFGDDSRATEVFAAITGDRYTGVTYDPVEKGLRVHHDGGDPLSTRQLSHATTEQLYLAARIGLAEQLLSAEPGFFLMDDTFLPADRERLREGFDVLRHLADDGWQILYFTAKAEVGETLVDSHDLPCRRLDSLE